MEFGDGFATIIGVHMMGHPKQTRSRHPKATTSQPFTVIHQVIDDAEEVGSDDSDGDISESAMGSQIHSQIPSQIRSQMRSVSPASQETSPPLTPQNMHLLHVERERQRGLRAKHDMMQLGAAFSGTTNSNPSTNPNSKRSPFSTQRFPLSQTATTPPFPTDPHDSIVDDDDDDDNDDDGCECASNDNSTGVGNTCVSRSDGGDGNDVNDDNEENDLVDFIVEEHNCSHIDKTNEDADDDDDSNDGGVHSHHMPLSRFVAGHQPQQHGVPIQSTIKSPYDLFSFQTPPQSTTRSSASLSSHVQRRQRRRYSTAATTAKPHSPHSTLNKRDAEDQHDSISDIMDDSPQRTPQTPQTPSHVSLTEMLPFTQVSSFSRSSRQFLQQLRNSNNKKYRVTKDGYASQMLEQVAQEQSELRIWQHVQKDAETKRNHDSHSPSSVVSRRKHTATYSIGPTEACLRVVRAGMAFHCIVCDCCVEYGPFPEDTHQLRIHINPDTAKGMTLRPGCYLQTQQPWKSCVIQGSLVLFDIKYIYQRQHPPTGEEIEVASNCQQLMALDLDMSLDNDD